MKLALDKLMIDKLIWNAKICRAGNLANLFSVFISQTSIYSSGHIGSQEVNVKSYSGKF